MNLTIDGGNIDFTLTPQKTVLEIIQNIKVIISTIKGSVVLDRGFGIDSELIDCTSISGKGKLMIYIIESLQEFEPRVEINSIDFIQDKENADKGIFFPKLEVHIKDEYIT